MPTTTGELDWSGCPLIRRDPQKMGGVSNIGGMRITPETILDNYEDGRSVAEIIEQFPSVSGDQIRSVLTYAAKRGYLTRPAA